MTDDRAEQAFTRAFRDHEEEFAPLDPAALVRPGGASGSTSRTPRPWLGLAAAAVALVLIVPIAAQLGPLLGGGSQTTAAGPAQEAVPRQAEAGVEAQSDEGGVSGASAGGPVAAGSAGVRWESMLDVSVAVPNDWGYDFAPGPDWCAGDAYERPAGPYVDRNPLSRALRSIACPGALPDDLRQTHLTWAPAEAGDSQGVAEVAPGWRRVERLVGSVRLVVEVPEGDLAVAEEILASARTDTVDPRGCAASLPEAVQGEPLAAGASASGVVVCQYADRPAGEPNLVGSYRLDDARAQTVVDAVAAYPVLPSEPPQTCTPTRETLVLHVDDVTELRLPLDGCRPTVFDDGQRTFRADRVSCADLLVGPLWKGDFLSEELGSACAPVR